MFIGEYAHTIDDKNRVSLPAKFRKEMGKTVIVSKGLDRCLYVFTLEGWKAFSQGISSNSQKADRRGFERLTFGGANEAEIDSIGRILVPDFLRDWADLKGKVSVLGVENRVEIWNEKSWKAYKAKIEKQAESLAERLG